MQNNDNQTNQKDPHNRGQNGFESISPGLCSIWLTYNLKVYTFCKMKQLVGGLSSVVNTRTIKE
jgi:hypothetical protein